MTEPDTTTTSDLAVKAVCVIGFINATQMVNLIFSPMTKRLGDFYPAYFSISVILSVICLIGLWLSKRWAAMSYVAILALNQLILLKMGFWEVTALIMPLIIAVLLWQNRALLN